MLGNLSPAHMGNKGRQQPNLLASYNADVWILDASYWFECIFTPRADVIDCALRMMVPSLRGKLDGRLG